MTVLGLDVAHYQAATPALVAGKAFILAKATEGTAVDPAFGGHVANARRAGLIVGAYHFGRDDVDLGAQVAAFLAAAASEGIEWLAFDVEGPHAWSVAQARQAIDQVHAAGLTVGLYASDSAYFDAGQDWRWVANWSASPHHPYDVWQYTSDGSQPGYTGRLDLDRWDGTLAELTALAGGPMGPFATYPTPTTATVKPGCHLYATDALQAIVATVPATMPGGLARRAIGKVGADVRIVDHQGTAVYVRRTDCSSIAADPPLDCTAPIAAAIAADRASAHITYG